MVAHRLVTTRTLPAKAHTTEATVRTGGLRQETDLVEVALTSPMKLAPALKPVSPNNAATTTENSSIASIHITRTSTNSPIQTLVTKNQATRLQLQPKVQGSDLSLHPQNPIHPGPGTQPPQLPATAQIRVVDTSHNMLGTLSSTG